MDFSVPLVGGPFDGKDFSFVGAAPPPDVYIDVPQAERLARMPQAHYTLQLRDDGSLAFVFVEA